MLHVELHEGATIEQHDVRRRGRGAGTALVADAGIDGLVQLMRKHALVFTCAIEEILLEGCHSKC